MSCGGQRDAQEDMISLLPHQVLDNIVQRLSVRDVWSLWQTNRAMQSAVQQCEWNIVVQLGSFSLEEKGYHKFCDGLLAVRMFAPGSVHHICLETTPPYDARCYHLCCSRFAQEAGHWFMENLPHVHSLKLDIMEWMTDMGALASLPSLTSLRVDIQGVPINPLRWAEPSTWPTPAASAPAATTSAAASNTQISAERSCGVHTRQLFPKLTSLHVVVWRAASVDFAMFSGLQELRMDVHSRFEFGGSLASMPLLTHLEVGGKLSAQHVLSSLEVLAHFPHLRLAKIGLRAFRRPFNFRAVRHVESVVVEGAMSREEELVLGRLAEDGDTPMEIRSLTCERYNPICVLPQLTSFTSLRAAHHDYTLGDNFAELRTLHLTMFWWMRLRIPIVLPHLETLELKYAPTVEEEWGRMLPNLVWLVLLDVCCEELPNLKKGSWPRLTVLEVKGAHLLTSISHTWFTLPSLQRFVVADCPALEQLPNIPASPEAESVVLRVLELSSCDLLRGLPESLVHLPRLSRVVMRGHRAHEFPVPTCLARGGTTVARLLGDADDES